MIRRLLAAFGWSARIEPTLTAEMRRLWGTTDTARRIYRTADREKVAIKKSEPPALQQKCSIADWKKRWSA